MSDPREHADPLARPERLKYMARWAALNHGYAQAYTPKNSAQAETFEPHDWVLRALELAFAAGRTEGQEDIRRSFRELIAARVP